MYSDYHKPSTEQLRQAVSALNDIPVEDVSIVNVAENEGTKPGENFASVMRIYNVESTADGKALHTSLMAKLGGKGSPMIKWWEEMRIFERENEFYSKILPKLNKIVGARESPLPFPRYALTSNQPPMLIMENLRVKDFVMCEAKNGWSLDQVELTMLQLAKFHAAGYHLLQSLGLEACNKQYPEVCNDKPVALIPVESEEIRTQADAMFMASYRSGSALVKNGLDDADLLERFLAYDIKIGATGSKAPSGDFDVIARSDSWSNNFMFRFDPDTKKPVDVRFVDLQACQRARPTYDVTVLLATSTTPEFREKNLLHVQEFYHRKLLEELSALGYKSDVYPWEQFQSDYKNSFAFALFFGFVNLQTLFNPKITEAAQQTDLSAMEKTMKEVESSSHKPKAEGQTELVKRLCVLVKEAGQLELF